MQETSGTALHALWDWLAKSAGSGKESFRQQLHHVCWTWGLARKAVLACWNNSPWDFGFTDKSVQRQQVAMEDDPKDLWSSTSPHNQQATVVGCLGDNAESLRNIKVAVVSVSNPGVCLGTALLKQREVINKTWLDSTDEHFNQGILTLSWRKLMIGLRTLHLEQSRLKFQLVKIHQSSHVKLNQASQSVWWKFYDLSKLEMTSP